MRKTLIAALVTVMAVAGGEPFTIAVAQAPSDAFAAGTAAFADEDFERALEHFEAALAAGLDGPAIHYNIGVCRYKLGRYPEARASFALIAEGYPEMRGLAEYNLGLVASKEGDDTRAHAHFRAALAATDDETVRYLAGRQLGLGGPDGGSDDGAVAEPSSQRWLALVDAQLGYDDNVLLLADEISLPDGQSAESRFAELWAFVSGSLGDDSRFRLDANFYALRYPEASIFDQSVLHVAVPYEWEIGAWRGEAGPHLSWTTIDGDLLDRRLGIGFRASRDIMERVAIGFRYVHDDVSEGDGRYAFFAGDRDWLEVRLDRRAERGRLTLAYALERNDRDAATVSPRRNRWSARYRHALNNDWLLDVQGSLRDSRYSRLPEPRDEDLTELVLGLTRTLPDGWQINTSFTVADNESNVATVSYDRRRVSVGVGKQF